MPLLALLVSLTVSHAAPLEFRLDCRDREGKLLPLQVVKKPMKKSGKWMNQYFVEGVSSGTKFKVELTPRGSGDEDYSEYKAGPKGDALNISGAAIQEEFKWVALTNTDGTSFADCRKAK